MKKVWILVILVFTSLLCLSYNTDTHIEEKESTISDTIMLKTVNIVSFTEDSLLYALIDVESKGKTDIVGDNGKAVGCLQMWKIMVRQVNQDLKSQGSNKRFTYNDRYDCEKSKEMFKIWVDCHHKDSSAEKIARNWNGGPKGFKQKKTIKYWNKVKNYFKSIKDA